MNQIDLSDTEIRLLIQSLEHCLATCRNKDRPESGPCTECEAAKALRDKLARQLQP